MIEPTEIDAKAEEFGIHTSHVQRDYVFSWLLAGISRELTIADTLLLKGGNCFRKLYFPDTRFSPDLDFSTESAIDQTALHASLNSVSEFAEEATGLRFNRDRTDVSLDRMVDRERAIYKAKLFFRDFCGEESSIEISVRLDVTEFDRIYLPTQRRQLIHPYSDAGDISATVACLSMEELLANKLKCLIQRRHSHDLYNLVYALLFDHEIDIDRAAVVRTFLRKTIFERSPGSARGILLGIPMAFFQSAWERYIAFPIRGHLPFDTVQARFHEIIDGLFDTIGVRMDPSLAFYPPELRNPIMDAGANKKIIRLTYDGITREVEPYSLAYKRRQDGVAQEYFYAWDRSGGSSGEPGIRAFLNPKVQHLEATDISFETRFPIELAKAGEVIGSGYFQDRFGGGRTSRPSVRSVLSGGRSSGRTYVIECPYCSKRFRRKTRSTTLRLHKDKSGYPCSGRRGYLVDHIF